MTSGVSQASWCDKNYLKGNHLLENFTLARVSFDNMEGEEFMAYILQPATRGQFRGFGFKMPENITLLPLKEGFRYVDAVSAHLLKSLF